MLFVVLVLSFKGLNAVCAVFASCFFLTSPVVFANIVEMGGEMVKKISCNVVKSVPLNEGDFSQIKWQGNSNCNVHKRNRTAPYINDSRVITAGESSLAGLFLDCYV